MTSTKPKKSRKTRPPRVTQADFDKLDEIRAELEEIREFNRKVREKLGLPPHRAVEQQARDA